MRQPQFVGALGFEVLGRAARVHVQIDKTGQHAHSGRVNLVVGLEGCGSLEGERPEAGASNRADPVALDDDVDRALGRRASPVNEDGAADMEAS